FRGAEIVCYRPLCSGKASSSSCYTKSHVDTTSTCYLFCIIILDPSPQSSAILYDLISLLRDARHIQARRRRRCTHTRLYLLMQDIMNQSVTGTQGVMAGPVGSQCSSPPKVPVIVFAFVATLAQSVERKTLGCLG